MTSSFSVSQGAGQNDDRRMVSASTGSGCCSIFHPVDQVIAQLNSIYSFRNKNINRFILEWCERGRGLKPDWATKGIEFLYFAANPSFTKFLCDDEFEV